MTGWAWKTPEPERAIAAAEKVLPTIVEPASARVHVTSDAGEPALDAVGAFAPIAAELLRKLSITAADRWGTVWAADERECGELATATLNVVRHELPDLESELADPWTKLAFVAATYALPRVLAIKFGAPQAPQAIEAPKGDKPDAAVE